MVEEDHRTENSGHSRLNSTRWGAIWAVFGAGLICGAYMTKVAPALPLQRAEFGLTLIESAFIATTFNVMGGLTGILAGTMCDRYGQRRLALSGLAIMALSGLLGTTAWNFPLLLASRFFEGVGFILFTVSGSTLISAAADPRDRARALGLWAAYMPTGGGLALLIAPPVIAAWGWRGLWVLLAMAAAACFVLAARYAPDPEHGSIAPLRLIRESLAQPGNIVFGLLFMFYVSQWASVMIWLPTFLVDERGASPANAALLTALMVLVNAPGNVAGGWLLSHGVRRGALVMAASAIMAACSAGMLGPGFLPDAARYLLCLVFSACAGVIPGAIFSGLPVHAKSPQHISTGNGIVMQASQIGQFLGPIALAWLATRFGGWGATLWAMLAFAVGGALCGFALMQVERDKMPQ